MFDKSAVHLIDLGLTLAAAAAEGIAEAVEAKRVVELCVAENRDPAAVEWDAINALTDAKHRQVQGEHG